LGARKSEIVEVEVEVEQSRIEMKKKNRNTLKQKRNLSVITGVSGDSPPKINQKVAGVTVH